jgi:hypothetical protein
MIEPEQGRRRCPWNVAPDVEVARLGVAEVEAEAAATSDSQRLARFRTTHPRPRATPFDLPFAELEHLTNGWSTGHGLEWCLPSQENS